jgi:hypothetical protein
VGESDPFLLLAATLVAAGVDLVVVGSASRLLRGERVTPNDLDIAIRPALRPALTNVLGAHARSERWGRRFVTSFGPLDVQYHDPLPAPAGHACIAGVKVAFA